MMAISELVRDTTEVSLSVSALALAPSAAFVFTVEAAVPSTVPVTSPSKSPELPSNMLATEVLSTLPSPTSDLSSPETVSIVTAPVILSVLVVGL